MSLLKISSFIASGGFARKNLRHFFLGGSIFDLSCALYTESLYCLERASHSEHVKVQAQLLIDLIKEARNRIPAYTAYRELKNVGEITGLPVVSKSEMRHRFEKGINTNADMQDFQIPQWTSGSTGIPFNFYLDKSMLPMRIAVYRRLLRWVGKESSDYVVRLMPREHPGLEREGILFKCGGPKDIEENTNAIYDLLAGKLVVLQSRVSYLVCLAQCMERDKKSFRFKAIISYTEQLFPEVRAYLEKVFQCPVFNYYASNEITAIGQECEKHDGFHINSEWALVEVVDDFGRLIEDGRYGRIIVTSLWNHVMPFIRYEIGDIGYWVQHPCACGRTLPRIKIEGRKNDSFLLPNGKTGILGALMWPLISNINKVFQYQVVRYSPTRYEVRIVPTEVFKQEDKKLIEKRFQEYLGANVSIIVTIAKTIEETSGGKQRAFINLDPLH